MCKKYPEPYSSYVCFARAIRDQNFSYEMISKWFNILVDKDDYVKNERKGIVKYLYDLSKDDRGEGVWGQKSPTGHLKGRKR